MIEILNQQHRYWINTKRFKRLLQQLTKHYRLKDPELVLAFVNTKKIKELNRRFLKKNRPTDVLSFPLREQSAEGKFYLGDIAISVPQAFKQCFLQKYGLERELEILTIHGFLHLLGIEHSAGIEQEEEKIRALLLKE
jgi:probable rRNA maturation factor